MAHTYQQVAFLLEHLGVDATISTGTSTTTGHNGARLVDYRASVPMQFAAAAANQYVDFDMGSTTVIEALMIPKEHNFTGDLQVRSGPTQGSGTLRATVAMTAGEAVIATWSHSAGDRWWRFLFVESGAWEVGELVLATGLSQLSVGVVPSWRSDRRTPAEVTEFPTFEVSLIQGAPRVTYELAYEFVTAAADLTILDALAALGTTVPFAMRPPDAEDGPLFVRFEEDPERSQESSVPSAVVAYGFRGRLVEQR